MYPNQTLFDLPFFSGSIEDVVAFIYKKMDERELVVVATPNPEQIVQSESTDLKKSWQAFNLFIPDGNGIVWASRKLGKALKGRVAGVDVVETLVKNLNERKETALIIGGEGYEHGQRSASGGQGLKVTVISHPERVPTVVGTTRDPLQLENVSWFSGFNKNSPEHSAKVLAWIMKNKPTYVFVALGAPHQERWVAEHRDELEKESVKVVMVVGGAFDMIFGKVPRAPAILRQLGIEWLWRLVLEPSRLGRQLQGAKFFWTYRRSNRLAPKLSHS